MSEPLTKTSVPSEVVDWVERLHDVVDELARPVAAANRERLQCRAGCSGCCSDDLTVFPIEAAVILRRHGELLAEGEPHAAGACAFLDAAGACRIYESRPYVCRTQGLPLRWLDEDEDGAPIEVRDICPLNLDGGPELEELTAEACWTLGPIEERLATRQAALASSHDAADGQKSEGAERVPLRALFARSGSKHRLPVVR